MNVNPFRRRGRRAEDSPVETALRRSLARHAFETPDADALTRRILAAANDEPDRLRLVDTPRRAEHEEHSGRGPWKTWGLPLVAAASVAAVVGIGAVVASVDHGNGRTHQAATQGPTTSRTTSAATRVASPSASSAAPGTAQVGTSELKNVRILDLTFYGTDDGVALASSTCLSGPGRCTALLQTSDGETWTQKGGGIDFDVAGVKKGCPANKCVDHIRFARSDVGYAYGPDAFFMTTDGGGTWQQQAGGAEALETLHGNVIRVEANGSGDCLPGCGYTVRTAAIGGTTWTPVPLPGGTPLGDGVQLSRGGTSQQDAYLLVTQNPAGSSSDEKSTLYSSSDDGTSWTDEGEPCRQSGGEVDSYQVVAGSGNDVTVLCRTRATGPFHAEVSNDGGTNFTTRAGTFAHADVAPTGYTDTGGALPTVLADSGTVLAVAGNGVSISTDGGNTFSRSQDLVGTFATVGFESTTVGRAVSSNRTQIWTTYDAGKTWQASTP